MDITNSRDLGKISAQSVNEFSFPEKLTFQDEVVPLLKSLNQTSNHTWRHSRPFTTNFTSLNMESSHTMAAEDN